MANSYEKKSSFTFPFASVLTLIFVFAKLQGVIAWSWWLVFLPVLIGPLIVLAILLVAAIGAAFVVAAKAVGGDK